MRTRAHGGEDLHSEPVDTNCEICAERNALVVVLLMRPGRSERGYAVCGGCFVSLGLEPEIDATV
jgi:hypothetical protein